MRADARIEQLPTLAHHVRRHAEREPGAVAATFEGTAIGYGELADRVTLVARALIASGIDPGDRVAMLTPPRPEYLEVFLALTEIGATWVGVNPRYTDGEIAHVVNDSAPSLFLCVAGEYGRDADSLTRLRTAVTLPPIVAVGGELPGTTSYDDFVARGASVDDTRLDERRAALDGTAAAAVVYTSGTTGAPKGALLSAAGMCRAAELQAARQYQPRMSVLAYLPIDHIGGLIDLGGVPLVAGGAVHLHQKFDADVVLHSIEHDRINLWGGIPTIFAITLAEPAWATTDISSLTTVAWGGAAMPHGLLQELKRTGARLRSVYGLTEACVTVTYSDEDADDDALTTTIGRPDERLGDVRLADADGTPVAAGEVGEIQVRDEGVMIGYINNPAATAEAFTADGYLRTGDLATERPDGNYALVGRTKEMYKSGGYNVYPREIELLLESFPGVAAVAVVPVPDPTYGEIGIAHVQPSPGADLRSEDLIRFAREGLANYKVPKRILVAEALPMRANGKIDKRALREVS